MSDDLATFLRERLDEDQEAAERTQPGPWIAVPAAMPGEMEIRHQMRDGRPDVAAAVATTHGLYCSGVDAAHIARHDPARVLAEVKAKRRIVELHAHRDGPHECPEWKWRDPDHPEDPWETETGWAAACLTLRLLASVYAEHPGYRSEWAP